MRWAFAVLITVAVTLAADPIGAQNIGRYFYVGSSTTPVPHPTFTSGVLIGGIFGQAPYSNPDRPDVQVDNAQTYECGAPGCTVSPTDGGMHRRLGFLSWYTFSSYWNFPGSPSAIASWCTSGCPNPTDIRALATKQNGEMPLMSLSLDLPLVPANYPTYPPLGWQPSAVSYLPDSVAVALGFPTQPSGCSVMTPYQQQVQGCHELFDSLLTNVAAGAVAYNAAVALRVCHECVGSCLISYVLNHGGCANGDSATLMPMFDPATCLTWPVDTSCSTTTVPRQAEILDATWEYFEWNIATLHGASNVLWLLSFTGTPSVEAEFVPTTCYIAGLKDANGNTMSCPQLVSGSSVYSTDMVGQDVYDVGGVSSPYALFNSFYSTMLSFNLPIAWIESQAPNSTVITTYTPNPNPPPGSTPCINYTPGPDTQAGMWYPYLAANAQSVWPKLALLGIFESFSSAPAASVSPSPVPSACGKDWNFDLPYGQNASYTTFTESWFASMIQGTPAPTSTPWPTPTP